MEDAPSPTSAPAQIPDLHSLLRRACEEFPALHHLDPLNLPEAAKNFIQTRSGFGREFSADEVNALRGWAAHHRMADCGFSDGGRALYVFHDQSLFVMNPPSDGEPEKSEVWTSAREFITSRLLPARRRLSWMELLLLGQFGILSACSFGPLPGTKADER
jgi:hypothetical protein